MGRSPRSLPEAECSLRSRFQRLVGRLIGQKGRAVSFLKRRSGAKIYVLRASPSRDVQICHVEGEFLPPSSSACLANGVRRCQCPAYETPGSRVQVDRALKLIGEKFVDLDLTNQSTALHPALTQPTLAPTTWVRVTAGGDWISVTNTVHAPPLMATRWRCRRVCPLMSS